MNANCVCAGRYKLESNSEDRKTAAVARTYRKECRTSVKPAPKTEGPPVKFDTRFALVIELTIGCLMPVASSIVSADNRWTTPVQVKT